MKLLVFLCVLLAIVSSTLTSVAASSGLPYGTVGTHRTISTTRTRPSATNYVYTVSQGLPGYNLYRTRETPASTQYYDPTNAYYGTSNRVPTTYYYEPSNTYIPNTHYYNYPGSYYPGSYYPFYNHA